MVHVDWYIEGPSFGSFNCGYAAPCQFEERPTQGDCRGFEVLTVTKGHFGPTDLAGCRVALIIDQEPLPSSATHQSGC